MSLHCPYFILFNNSVITKLLFDVLLYLYVFAFINTGLLIYSVILGQFNMCVLLYLYVSATCIWINS